MLLKLTLPLTRAFHPRRFTFVSRRRPILKAYNEFQSGPILVDSADLDVHGARRETRLAKLTLSS